MYNKRMSENDKIDELSEQVLKDATNFQARRELVIALMEKAVIILQQLPGRYLYKIILSILKLPCKK